MKQSQMKTEKRWKDENFNVEIWSLRKEEKMKLKSWRQERRMEFETYVVNYKREGAQTTTEYPR